MYLDVADSQSLPYGWSRYAQFSLAVVNQIHNKFTIRKGIPFIVTFVYKAELFVYTNLKTAIENICFYWWLIKFVMFILTIFRK